MHRLLIDQDFAHRIVRGLQLRSPGLDIVFASGVGLARADDPDLLEWAANQNRVTLSHDIRTLRPFAYERISSGKRMPGLIVVLRSASFATAIDDILIILECCSDDELEGQVYVVPI